jgi:(E)-4-hydroxy-3-methylbut-2-enyl-diphosphate synthase
MASGVGSVYFFCKSFSKEPALTPIRIRVSLASDPVDEVRVGFDILKSLSLRQKGVNLIACPSCSRQKFDVIKVVNELEARLEDINEPIDVAVIGCVVNGPGEAKAVSVGLTGGEPNLMYIDDYHATNFLWLL